MSNELEESIIMSPRYFIGNWPHVLNMANSIIGVSVLALPFCFKQCGILLGFLLLMGSAWLTRLTCHLLMKSAFATKKRSYEYLAFHIFGRAGKLLVELSIIGLLIGTCIAFYIIIGDLGPSVVSKFTGLENTPQLRSVLLILLTGFVVVPLAMLHSLDSLSNFSAISLTFYCIFVVEVIIAAFPNLWSGIWVSKVVFWNTDGVFKCLPIFALCFACQTQLFIMSDALPEPSLNRINRIVHSAVVMCSVIYVSVGCFGYIAFCDDYISGDILMNFSPTFFSEAIKLGFVVSTLISFPLVIFPCRASLYTLLFVRESNDEPIPEKGLHENFGGAVYIPPSYFKGITVSIIGVTLTIGLLVPNIEFMLAITGATMGSLICYILPAVLFITAISVDHGGNTRSFAQLVLLIGVTILLASSYVTLVGEDKVVKHESVVKLGQPIEHNEDNLPIHNDEELKKKLDEMKKQDELKDQLPLDHLPPDRLPLDQLPLVNAKVDGINPDLVGSIKKDIRDAVTAAAALPSKKQEVIDSITVSSVVDKNKQIDGVVDKSKEVVAADSKLPDTEDDKRKEPPNPHAPVEVVVQEKIEDLKEDSEAVGNHSREEEDAGKDKNQNLVEQSVDSASKKSAEKPLDEKTMSHVTDGPQQQELYGRPVLADVLQPKLEIHQAANGKVVDSDEGLKGKPQAEKVGDTELQEMEPPARKVVEADGARLEETPEKSLDSQNVSKQRPVEVPQVPEARARKAPMPDEQSDLQKTIDVKSKSENAADVDDKAPADRHADADQHEAKVIIAELKKQQQEQRKLLDEHRKIIDELKRHQIEVHQEAASPASKGPDQALGEKADDKAKPESVQKKLEKMQQPIDSLEEEEKAERAIPKTVGNDSPRAVAKESNKHQHMDNPDRQLSETNKVVKKNVVETEILVKKNVNIQDPNHDHGNKNSKTGNVNKNAPDVESHPKLTHDNVANVDSSLNEKIPKHDHMRNIDGLEHLQSEHRNQIVLKGGKLDYAANEKLIPSQTLNRSEIDIPVFVSVKS